MPAAHRPESPFAHLLRLIQKDDPELPFFEQVLCALEILSASVQSLPQNAAPNLSQSADPRNPENLPDYMTVLLKTLDTRGSLEQLTPQLLFHFANAEHFNVERLFAGYDKDGNERLRQPSIVLWAELNDYSGALEVFWDDAEGASDYVNVPQINPRDDIPNLICRLDPELWETPDDDSLTATQRELMSLLPCDLLICLGQALHSLGAVCDLTIGDWPELLDGEIRIVAADDRHFLHLLQEVRAARSSLDVVRKAAAAVLAPYGVRSAEAFIKLRNACKKQNTPLAQGLSAAAGKPCSPADVQRLARYVQHVEEGRKLLNALYRVGKMNFEVSTERLNKLADSPDD